MEITYFRWNNVFSCSFAAISYFLHLSKENKAFLDFKLAKFCRIMINYKTFLWFLVKIMIFVKNHRIPLNSYNPSLGIMYKGLCICCPNQWDSAMVRKMMLFMVFHQLIGDCHENYGILAYFRIFQAQTRLFSDPGHDPRIPWFGQGKQSPF